MSLPRFFVDRPIFAAVLSIVITLLGALAYFALPIAQYPEVAPPTVIVTASFPGADAQTLAETVSTPLEQEINGVERMLYMSSSSTSDGRVQITITFELGTDLDKSQVLVQNRVNSALPRLPKMCGGRESSRANNPPTSPLRPNSSARMVRAMWPTWRTMSRCKCAIELPA